MISYFQEEENEDKYEGEDEDEDEKVNCKKVLNVTLVIESSQ